MSLRAPLAVLTLAATLVLPAAPGALAGEPTDQFRERMDRVLRTLQDPALQGDGRAAERRAAVRRVADDIFDFPETARRALAQHWTSRTPAEREEFVRLFADLFEDAYVSKIDLLSGDRVTYLGEATEGGTATIQTRIVTRQGSELPVGYRLLRRGDRWRVFDVLIDGISLIANYRSQFNKIIQTSSYQELVRRLKARRDEVGERRS